MLAVSSQAQPAAFSSNKDANFSHTILQAARTNAGGLSEILATPVEFIEGSSCGLFAVPHGLYQPINVADDSTSEPLGPQANQQTPGLTRKIQDPDPDPESSRSLPLRYPQSISNAAYGFYNTGNTCFVNSVLQSLLHIPPLLHVLLDHKKTNCSVLDDSCITCKLRTVMLIWNRRAATPSAILGEMHRIAKHFRRGRQEDAHEFLRYLIEALQRSCVPHLDPKLHRRPTETTWIHHIFGGQLRSRVKCRECGHPSDTIDTILDLSIDIHGTRNLKEALHKFTKLDILKGADRYKCEKCNRPVIAEKGLTVHTPPLVLTIHLKRFTPLGRKLTNPLSYDEILDLQPYMSENQFGPTYRLSAVISHAGSGPNSGHYFAFVRSKLNRWMEMNDDTVQERPNAFAHRNAYVLFYIQQAGEALRKATWTSPIVSNSDSSVRSDLDRPTAARVQTPAYADDLGVPAIPESRHQTQSGIVDSHSRMLRQKIDQLENQPEKVPKSPTSSNWRDAKDTTAVDTEMLPSAPEEALAPSLPTEKDTVSSTIGLKRDRNEAFSPPDNIGPHISKRKLVRDFQLDFGPKDGIRSGNTPLDTTQSARSSAGHFTSNPFGGASQYRDSLGQHRLGRENKGRSMGPLTTSSGQLRRSGVKHRMKRGAGLL